MLQNLERMLPSVEKPARYAGGEWNSVKKDWEDNIIKIAFCFPDVYEVGMSHLGLQIMYHVVNSRDDALMERSFAPWVDMEELLRKNDMSLFSLESHRPLGDFDIIAFTLQYEMSFTNILNMLDLAGILLRSRDRGENHPLVIAGGPCAFNPEPLADFIDMFALGEGEELINDIIDLYKGARQRGIGRPALLREAAAVPGIYVPALYSVEYRSDGSVDNVTPLDDGLPRRVLKRVVKDLDRAAYPHRPIVPYMGIVHDRIMLEVMRGCTRGCRFCQAGVIYRPVREKSPETLMKQAGSLVENTGYDEISLTSLSTLDYSGVAPVVKGLLDSFGEQRISLSLPSLRVDAFSVDLAKEVQRVRRSSLTFAPEAGTQRLRDVINKGVKEEDLIEAVSAAFGSGWNAIKLYFMIGLPSETRDDLDGIVHLARRVLECGRRQGVSKGRLKVTVSASSFVPKSHTPFQWEPQATLQELKDKQNYLRDRLKIKGIVFNWHDPGVSFLEAALARGDRRLGRVLELARELGCRFDGWSECFRYDLWQQAFAMAGLDADRYAYRRYDHQDILPWDHIDSGIHKGYLIREHRKAMSGEATHDCRRGKCPGCGLCPTLEMEPKLLGGEAIAPVQSVF